MNVVMIIPTGIGCEIGGHAGDANPVARLLASVCDNLLVHPNVVNASDLNEMTDNTWYVEGSILDRFLEGKFYLHKPKSNKILAVSNDSLEPATRNSIEASMYTLGTDIKSITLKTPIEMEGIVLEDHATGIIKGEDALIDQISGEDFDALAIHSKVMVTNKTAMNYLRCGGINPYGAVEAILSRHVANKINKPVAHSPVEELEEPYTGLSYNPRMSASLISTCYLNSILKGLHRAPRITKRRRPNSLGVNDIDCLITPMNCVGRPHIACLERGIPVIAVRENKTKLQDIMPLEFIEVSNYMEAAGYVAAIKAGLNYKTLTTKNIPPIEFLKNQNKENDGCGA